MCFDPIFRPFTQTARNAGGEIVGIFLEFYLLVVDSKNSGSAASMPLFKF
jgi:hypothetical protein